MKSLLKLIAFDEEDLGVLSFQVHNAHLQVKDIISQKADNRLILIVNRFDWEEALATAEKVDTDVANENELSVNDKHNSDNCSLNNLEEIPALLCFDHVANVRSYGIDRKDCDRVLSLKGICFRKNQAPSGTVDFLFTDNVGLQCDVECLEARLEDLPEDE